MVMAFDVEGYFNVIKENLLHLKKIIYQ